MDMNCYRARLDATGFEINGSMSHILDYRDKSAIMFVAPFY